MAVDKDEDLMSDVFASDRDRGADHAAPETEAKVELSPESVEKTETKGHADAEDKDSSKQYRDPENGRFVPLTELKSEREKRQEAQRMRDEAEKRVAEYERRFQDLERRFQTAQYPQPQQQMQRVQPPDPFTDPEAYQQFVVEQAQTVALSERLNTSQMLAEEKYGAQVVEEALQAALRAGVNHHFIKARNPFAELVAWHKRNQGMQRIGDDVEGFEKRIREEERQKVLAELKQGNKGQPQRFPGTLADATASGGQGAILTDEAMMADVFSSERRARRSA